MQFLIFSKLMKCSIKLARMKTVSSAFVLAGMNAGENNFHNKKSLINSMNITKRYFHPNAYTYSYIVILKGQYTSSEKFWRG